jgi:diadenosine tetraphosphate (Ap4A) HIT family hydrolase
MPRVLRGVLRGIFRKRRELLLDLSQCAAEAVAEYVRKVRAWRCAALLIESRHHPDSFSIGGNVGEAAGQTAFLQ